MKREQLLYQLHELQEKLLTLTDIEDIKKCESLIEEYELYTSDEPLEDLFNF
tara:strand:- start:5066 stop:5221 length:156 start_codon:yes stop_codon:yes gene_type:complete